MGEQVSDGGERLLGGYCREPGDDRRWDRQMGETALQSDGTAAIAHIVAQLGGAHVSTLKCDHHELRSKVWEAKWTYEGY